jgi:hypothetical protein
MKLIEITIDNFIRIPFLRMRPIKPVVVVAGDNEQGKSSLAEAIRFLFLEQAPRVHYKKDRVEMVHGAAKNGSVTIESGKMTMRRYIRDGKLQGDGGLLPADSESAAVCMQASTLPKLDERERRQIIMRLAKVDLSVDTIAAKLIDKGVDPAAVTKLRPLLKGGLQPAREQAKREVSDARGAWREVTGEAYGSQKAEGWKPADPAISSETAAKSLADIDAQLAELKADRDTRLEAHFANIDAQSAELSSAKQSALEPVLANIQNYEQQLARPTPLACPHCGGIVSYQDGELHQSDNIDKPRLSNMLSIAQLKRKEIAAEFDGKINAVIESRRETTKLITVEYETAAKGLTEDKAVLVDQITTSERAKQKSVRADELHRKALTHDRIATLLSDDADGVASELIAAALTPLNERLMEIGLTLGWTPPTIHGDMRIVRADGYGYNMLSESAMWRVDAMLQILVSELSGFDLLIFDRLDVLRLPDRGQFMQWLNDYVPTREGLSVFVMATLKQRPDLSALGAVDAYWIENGKIS